MKYLRTYESFSSLTDEQKIKLQEIVDTIKSNSIEKVNGNSEISNPIGLAKNPFYDRGDRQLQGLGNSFANIVPGSVNKKDGKITAEILHGAEYESGLRKEYTSMVTIDEKTLEYKIKKIK